MRKFFYGIAATALFSASAVGFIATTGSADPASSPATPDTSQAFGFTGATQTFVVPTGVTSISVDAFGAQGGAGSTCFEAEEDGDVSAAAVVQLCGDAGTGGMGAHATSTISVTPGETLTVVVGGQGGAATDSNDDACEGQTDVGTPGGAGFGGGGAGGTGGCPAGAGGGGGGATWILRGSTPLLVAAGGGGGGGAGDSAGPALAGGTGGASGSAGHDGDNAGADNFCPGLGGAAGTSAAGGAGGAGGSGCTAVVPGSVNGFGVHAAQEECGGVGVDGDPGTDGTPATGGTGGDGGIEADIMGGGGGGGGGGLASGGGGGAGGANCRYVAGAAGGGGGGASLGTTIVEAARTGDGGLTITFAAPAAQAVAVTPHFTG
jgi:hypothetical protein